MCYGHGWWPVGGLVPIGELDASEWPYSDIVQCPWCGVGGDNKSDRFKALKKYKEEGKDKDDE